MSSRPLQLVIPFHQPLTASESAVARACDEVYAPLLDTIAAAPRLRVAVHFTGHLLDYLSRRQDRLLLSLRELVQAERVEVLGGLFYGGPPALLPELDLRGQLQMMAEFWESFVGSAPVGYWLPDLAWAVELPRLLDESGLAYGFVSSTQLVGAGSVPPRLGRAERGGLAQPLFVLHAPLSSGLPGTPVDEWLTAVHAAAAAGASSSPLSVWVRAESLGLEPGTQRWCAQEGWLAQWIAALTGDEIETVLPRATFATARIDEGLRLRPTFATELGAVGVQPGPVEWADFPMLFPELGTLVRRMLRLSDKLRLAITSMEEEGLEEDWSDTLATAQRLLFSAQASEVYWRGAEPGFSDPAMRDAVMTRLCQAERMIDVLVQGEDDWLALEEEDRDGDRVDEVFVANRRLAAWIVPARAGLVRALDDRELDRTLLDAGPRREEPFFAEAAAAPRGLPEGPPRRGQNLIRLADELPMTSDALERGGIRERLLEVDVSPSELFAGRVGALAATPSELLENRIDEEGDVCYRLRLRATHGLDGLRPTRVTLDKELTLPLDAAELRLVYQAEVEPAPALLAVELPLRLGASPAELWCNGEARPLVEATLPAVGELRLLDRDGCGVGLSLEPAQEVWVTPLATTVRDLAGYRPVSQGVFLVVAIRLEGSTRAALSLRLVHPEPEPEPESASVELEPTGDVD